MAVEQDPRVLEEPPEEGHTGRQLVDKERTRLELAQLSAPGDGAEEMDLSKDREEDLESAQDGRGEESIAPDAHLQRAISRLVEAVTAVAVRGEDDDFVTEVL